MSRLAAGTSEGTAVLQRALAGRTRAGEGDQKTGGVLHGETLLEDEGGILRFPNGPTALRDLMSLYKYVPDQIGIKYLNNWSLRYSPPSALNDPFELGPVFDADAVHRHDVGLLKFDKEISREFGLPEIADRSSDPGFDPTVRVGQFRLALGLMLENLGVLCFSRTHRLSLAKIQSGSLSEDFRVLPA